MKRPVAFGLAFTLIFGALVACDSASGDPPIDSDEPATNPPSTPGTPPTNPAGRNGHIGKFERE